MADMDLARFLEDKIDRFMSSEDAGDKMRRKAEMHIDYFDGKQWTDAEVKELKRRGQPAITQNLVKQKIEFLQGLEKTQRTVPNALPRTPKHEEEAHGATDALRFIADDNRYNPARSAVWSDLLKTGWGGFQVTVVPQSQRRMEMMASTVMTQATSYRVVIARCQWDRMFWDPYSAEPDYSDASYLGMVVWMDRDDAVRRYGEEAATVFDETVATVSANTYDDKPKNYTWVQQGKRKRVRVIQMYYIAEDGEWDYVEFTKGGILDMGPSPWLDEDDKREHPYAWQSSYVDRDNNRYGAIQELIDMQDEVNKRRSKALHTVNSRQTFGSAAANSQMDERERRKQLARPDGHVDIGAGEWGKTFGVIPTTDIAAGNMEMLAQAMGVFETLGPNASLQGKSEGQDSGRAILAKQQAGAVQMGTLTDTLREVDLEVYRKAWRRVRQFWTGETWVRVTDDEKNLKWVGFNKPVMQPMMVPQFDQVTGQAMMGPAMGPDGQPMEAPAVDPQTGQPVMENAIAEMDVDIEIDTAPDMGTLQQEEFTNMVDLARVGVVFPPKVYLSMSNLRNKGELIRMMEEAEQGANQPPPEQQAAVRLELEGKQAENAKTVAEVEGRQVDTLAKVQEMQLGALMAGRPQPEQVTA